MAMQQVDGGMMSTSQEVLALRRAVLNPVTCQHFRLFLSLRGELLENDLLFWLEVQRYKVREAFTLNLNFTSNPNLRLTITLLDLN